MTYKRGMERKLPRKIRSTPAWKHFAQAIDAVLGHNILDPIGKAIDLRDPAQIEDFFLPRLANMLGFNLQVDYYDEEQRRKVVASLYEYWNVSGTPKFQEFLRLNAPLVQELIPLWTQDYETFVRYPTGKTVYEDPDRGTWFLTPHFELYTDGIKTYEPKDFSLTGMLGTDKSQLGKLFLGHGKRTILTFDDLLNEDFVVNLFYDLAPVHLVLERVVRGYRFDGIIHTMGMGALSTYTGRPYNDLTPYISLLDVDFLVEQQGEPEIIVPNLSYDITVELEYQVNRPSETALSTLSFVPDYVAVPESATSVSFSLSLYPPRGSSTNISYTTVYGSSPSSIGAVAGIDYVETSGTAILLAGQTSVSISVPLLAHAEGVNRGFYLKVLPVASLGLTGGLTARCEIIA